MKFRVFARKEGRKEGGILWAKGESRGELILEAISNEWLRSCDGVGHGFPKLLL